MPIDQVQWHCVLLLHMRRAVLRMNYTTCRALISWLCRFYSGPTYVWSWWMIHMCCSCDQCHTITWSVPYCHMISDTVTQMLCHVSEHTIINQTHSRNNSCLVHWHVTACSKQRMSYTYHPSLALALALVLHSSVRAEYQWNNNIIFCIHASLLPCLW